MREFTWMSSPHPASSSSDLKGDVAALLTSSASALTSKHQFPSDQPQQYGQPSFRLASPNGIARPLQASERPKRERCSSSGQWQSSEQKFQKVSRYRQFQPGGLRPIQKTLPNNTNEFTPRAGKIAKHYT